MSPLAIGTDLGVELEVLDEPQPAAAPTATDTMFYVRNTALSGTPTGLREINSIGEAKSVYAGELAILADLETFFNVGGARVFVSSLETTPIAAVGLFTPQMGPGQVVLPDVVTAVDLEPVKDWAWDNNRILVANGADGASAATLETLATSLIDSSSGRFAMLEADTVLVPGGAGGTTREVRGSVVKAALMARSDINTGNPNLAAAGNHVPGGGGQVDYAVGIKAERPFTEIQDLAESQVNCFRTVNNRVRAYGDWTLADLSVLPHWWNMSGSRTVMAVRAREQAVAEELMFGQIAADGLFLDKYNGALSGVLAELQRAGAIYGSDSNPGYRVTVGGANNPLSEIAVGQVEAEITMRTSPEAVALKITLIRRAITQEA